MASGRDFNKKTYYEVLDISPGSTLPEIKLAYKNKLLALHPDKILQNSVQNGDGDNIVSHPDNKSTEDLIPLLKEAYKVLSDSEHRKEYDEEVEAMLKKNGIVNYGDGLDTYTLDDFTSDVPESEEDPVIFRKDCPRCTISNGFVISEDDLIKNTETNINSKKDDGSYQLVLQCDSCSLWLKVKYFDLDEDDEE
ncbi:hypothetical protein B5S28_g3177 [[Candida] boidinii]|uniref:Unnamed protein product n=1 Tax=Candida boidinii TaxID=5477 RepID=A0ACB5TLK6_CANBO|nr:hypothetical protein B5S28_g3177 [[Candida] boidinii]OWB62981.1 hypothetical protein B5S29_g3933 [[Candida] boidinii]GME90628.1 unnamed protein product [[Candida] boidinii]